MARLEIIDVRVRRDAARALDDGVELPSKGLDARGFQDTRNDEIAVFVIKAASRSEIISRSLDGSVAGFASFTSRLAPPRSRGQTSVRAACPF